jgi:Xaa-Pro aminopeptidase
MKARLMVADSEHDANMLYAVKYFVPDPFIWLDVRGHRYAVLSDLEIDRGRKCAAVDRVLSLSTYQKRLKQAGIKQPRLPDIVGAVLRQFRVRSVEVPANFPVGLAKKLRGIRVVAKDDPFFPARQLKTAEEVRRITDAEHLAEAGMKAGIDVIGMSRIGRDGFLRWRGRKLTSEHVQGVINATIAGLGGVSPMCIVACGNQACDPHETGHGPLRAHWPIIVDIFPRDTKTGYWGDITRTVVRGRARDAVKKMYATVEAAQRLALGKLRAGVDGQDVHNAVVALFKREGFETGRKGGRMRGFFHGTGHGVGLEIHELPRVAAVPATLRAGHVVTIEPGLYYWGVGGVRLEDVALVTKTGMRNLTTFPKQLEV